MYSGIRDVRFAVISVLLLCAIATQTGAAIITVTNTNDSGPGSLRQALAIANDGDTIDFAVTGNIGLVSAGLEVEKNVTIRGPGADRLSIDGNHAVQSVFSTYAGVTISGLTISNGGVGISNSGTLTVTGCVVTYNSSTGLINAPFPYGETASLTLANSTIRYNGGSGVGIGAAHAKATLAIVNCTISGNSTNLDGGGIATGSPFGGVSILVKNSRISGNSAAGSGGGIFCDQFVPLSIENSTISGNSAASDGGGVLISPFAVATIVNSTISGNSAGSGSHGGGFSNFGGGIELTNSTISNNSAGSGGGIYSDSVVQISNTILNVGALGANIVNDGGTVTSSGYNLSSDDGGGYLTGPGDQINTDPMLGPLQDNGGPTETHALLLGSPAIDQGNSGGVYLDQRHFHRPVDIPGIPNAVGGDSSDIGAFEFGSFPLREDFNGDGFTDYLLFNVNRATAIWYLHDNTYISGSYGPSVPTGWTVADVADFNGDGNPDYALFNASTRQTAIWYLNNSVRVGAAFGPTLPSGWQLVAVGDFNRDGKPDYVLYNANTRQTAIWYLNNNIYVSGALGPTLPSGWQLVAIGDFNGDSKPDYALYNASTRQTAIWYLNNNVYVSGAYGPTVAAGYVLSGVADFNVDGHPDYLLYNPTTRQTAMWYLNNNVFLGGAWGPTLPAGWSLVAP